MRFSAQSDPQASDDPNMAAPTYASTETRTDPAMTTVRLKQIEGVKLWDLQAPQLYTVRVRLYLNGQVLDEDTQRVGFREASFTDHGFSLNGHIVKLRGLDPAPDVSVCRPGNAGARAAAGCLHSAQRASLQYCSPRRTIRSLGIFWMPVMSWVCWCWKRSPGWQHIGPEPWKQISIDNVGRMIRRDWNHPSIVLWGVRINESQDDHSFYTRTNALAHGLDPSRQTGGIRFSVRHRVAGRCDDDERLRLSVAQAESSTISEYGVRGAYVSDEEHGR